MFLQTADTQLLLAERPNPTDCRLRSRKRCNQQNAHARGQGANLGAIFTRIRAEGRVDDQVDFAVADGVERAITGFGCLFQNGYWGVRIGDQITSASRGIDRKTEAMKVTRNLDRAALVVV